MPVIRERVSEAEVRARLAAAIATAGNANRFAKQAGVTAQYLHDVRRGLREIGPTLAKALGLEKVTESYFLDVLPD
jgi:hypothetical protein